MKNSKIEWTHHTFNPWWGCTQVSPACAHCYAMVFAKRLGLDIWGPDKPRRFFGAQHWQEPLKWNADARERGVRERVFCASMADVFEDYQGPDRNKLSDARIELFNLIQETPHLDWLLLTKRPENVMLTIPAWTLSFAPQNIWIGTTVENQEQANIRIPQLLKIPARVRFLSCEPLLGEVHLDQWLWKLPDPLCKDCPQDVDCECGFDTAKLNGHSSIDWVICGGESGHGARPMHPEWARDLCVQCHSANVPFFFKQWGDFLPSGQDAASGQNQCMDADFLRVGKARAGRLLDGREWSEFPS